MRPLARRLDQGVCTEEPDTKDGGEGQGDVLEARDVPVVAQVHAHANARDNKDIVDYSYDVATHRSNPR